LSHGRYRGHTDEQMKKVRRAEQKKAALVGDYAGQVLLDHPSGAVRGKPRPVIEDLKSVLEVSSPSVVYTHSLSDKHDTHVAVALRVVQACREASSENRPTRVLGCEVWRDLDWLADADKVQMSLRDYEHLERALLGVFDSQIAGGKRYDTAVMGRRQAHATFSQTHATDDTTGRVYAMDLTPLLANRKLDPVAYGMQLIDNFRRDVQDRIRRLG
jgi:LmbE family N-acetylglucosaminyl deacetylase